MADLAPAPPLHGHEHGGGASEEGLVIPRDSVVHHLPPQVKLVCLLAFMIVVVAAPTGAWGLLGLDALLLGVDGVAVPQVRVRAAEAGAVVPDAAPAPLESPIAPQMAIDEAIKVSELVHRIADAPITLRSRSQLPAATARTLGVSHAEALDAVRRALGS